MFRPTVDISTSGLADSLFNHITLTRDTDDVIEHLEDISDVLDLGSDITRHLIDQIESM